jgi:hypothetical protein
MRALYNREFPLIGQSGERSQSRCNHVNIGIISSILTPHRTVEPAARFLSLLSIT